MIGVFPAELLGETVPPKRTVKRKPHRTHHFVPFTCCQKCGAVTLRRCSFAGSRGRSCTATERPNGKRAHFCPLVPMTLVHHAAIIFGDDVLRIDP